MLQHRGWSLVPSTRRLIILAWIALVAILAAFAIPTRAQEQVDSLPFVNNFATARFKLLTTVDFGGQKAVAFGEGAVVLPDRASAWIATDQSGEITHVVQIGSTVYQRVGGGAWERTESPTGVQAQPVSAQFNELQQHANAILNFGPENVGNVPAVRYQVWLSGDKLFDLGDEAAGMLPDESRDLLSRAVVKYDFWVSPRDSFLYQQNIEVTFPETEASGVTVPGFTISSLTTYYDINNPNISVHAPI